MVSTRYECTGHNALSLEDTTLRTSRTQSFPKNALSPRLDMPRIQNTHIEKTNTQARNKDFLRSLCRNVGTASIEMRHQGTAVTILSRKEVLGQLGNDAAAVVNILYWFASLVAC